MLNLSESKSREITRILGNISYMSEVHRAEDIVALFCVIPKEFHLAMIERILFSFGFCEVNDTPDRIGVVRLVDYKKVILALESPWGAGFLEDFHVSLDDGSLEGTADAIFSSMEDALDSVQIVAIFVYAFSRLRRQNVFNKIRTRSE